MARFLALGDSYTIGEGVPSTQSWPIELCAALALQWPETVWPDVVAATGWSADELLAALEGAALQPPYDLVSVLIGVNDQYRNRELAEHLPHFNTVLSHAVACADGDPGRVFVVSIPDWGVSAFADGDARGRPAIAAAIDAYNQAQKELCTLRGIAHADITAISRACGGDDSMFVDDRLHPSAQQYRRWLEVIVPIAESCLRRCRSESGLG